jgi:hypothetical protein
MKTLIGSVLALVVVAVAPLTGQAQPRPASGAKSLLEIVTALEETYDPIVEASFDDGAWEVEAFKGDTAYELAVDPRSGSVVSEFRDFGEAKPPAGSLRLSEIISTLAQAGYSGISEISFERQLRTAELGSRSRPRQPETRTSRRSQDRSHRLGSRRRLDEWRET